MWKAIKIFGREGGGRLEGRDFCEMYDPMRLRSFLVFVNLRSFDCDTRDPRISTTVVF